MIRNAFGIVVVVLALVGAAPVLGSAALNPNGLRIFPVEGVNFSGTVANFTDPSAGKPTYKATIDWGDGSSISNATLVKTGNDNAYDVNGQHTYTEEGTYSLRVVVSGGTGPGEATPTAQVSDAPLTAKVAVPSVVEGGSPSGAIATFTDLDPNDNASEYTVTIDWGDGSTGPGTVIKTGAGAFSVSGSHSYGEEGPRTVGVTVKDAGGSTATATQAITVADAPLTPGGPLTRRGTEGRPLRAAAVAAFHDAFAGATVADYSAATINWGDGTSSAGTISPAPGGRWQVGGSHTYREEGHYATTVVVTDRGGAMMTAHGTSIIADAPLHAYGQRIAAGLRQQFRGVVTTFTDAKFGAVGTSPHPDDYTVTINWGDGHSSAGTISTVRVVSRGRRLSRFAVTGAHAYTSAGLKHVTVLIHDRGGAEATARSQVIVSA